METRQAETRGRRTMSRRGFLALVGLGAGVGVGSAARRARAASVVVPTGPVFYQVALAGATPYGEFRREGLLLVEPPLDTSGVNFDNGINARDVGLISGNPPGVPEVGAIWYATNTGVYGQMGLGASVAQDLALLDTAYVTADEAGGLLSVVVDGQFWGLPAARSSQLNCFTPSSGLLAFIYQIIQGGMSLQFSPDATTVAGAIDFVGNGYIEPGTSRYVANFEGVAIRG